MAAYPGETSFDLFTTQGPPDPLVQGFLAGGAGAPANGVVQCPQTWGVDSITLTCGGSSTSYQDRDHAPIAEGRAGHFFFAPKEDQVTVAWTLKDGQNAETMVMELYRAGSGAPIWRKTFNAAGARQLGLNAPWDGSFPRNEWVDQVRFPNGVVTAASSPYMLKIRAEGAHVEVGYEERFTYFDVLVDSIELAWGDFNMIPMGPAANVAAPFHASTEQAEANLVQQLSGGNLQAARIDVVLPCNTFLDDAAQMKGDYLFERHRDQWGDGPRIPLLARISLAKAQGGRVHGGDSAMALHDLEILWDWESEDETALLGGRYPTAAVRNYLQVQLGHQRDDGTCPEGSTNCHVDHGGKRGGPGVFHDEGQAFEFRVTPCATRIWAATSTPKLDGARAGTAGVLFQPSRMARDTYRVSAWVARINGAAVLDVVDSAATLRGRYDDLPTASTGLFDISRSIRARYIRKTGAVGAANVVAASAQHLLAGVRIDWSANEDAAFQNLYETYIDRIKTRALITKAGAVSPAAGAPVPQWMEELAYAYVGLSQAHGETHAALTAWDYDVFLRKHRVDATRDYVNRDRMINTPRRRYQEWRHANGPHASDENYLLGVYNGLSNRKKGAIDADVTNRITPIGCATRQAYEDRCSLTGMHAFKRAGSQYLIETANANNEGFITFHTVDTVRFRRQNGAYTIVPSDIGGLAPSFETLDERAHAMLLIYLPTVVRGGLANHYTVSANPVIAHEAGHTFFLCHALADMTKPGVREAGSFSREHHDPADLLCIMNYDFDSDHLCGLCNLKLRGWSLRGLGLPV